MKAYEHLIRYALANGATVSVWDGGAWDKNRAGIDNAHHLIAAVEAVDEAEIIIRDKHDRRLGWARVSAYGLADDETVIDHTVNDYMDAWSAAYEAHLAAEPITTPADLQRAGQVLARGHFGGFAAAIGDAATRADSHNLKRLAAAFPELFAAAIETANDRQQPQTIGDICGAPLTGSNW